MLDNVVPDKLESTENMEELNSIEIETQPEQAIKNIQGAKEFNVDADHFADAAETYTVAMNETALPNKVHRVYAEKMSTDRQRIAVARKDSGFWNTFSNTLTAVERGGVQREANNLWYRRLQGETLSDEETDKLLDLQEKIQGLPQPEDFGDVIVPEVVNSLIDLGRGALEGGRDIAIGTGIGAAAGSILPGAGTVAGALTGLTWSTTLNMARDSYRQSSAGMYAELSGELTENDPNPEATETVRKTLSKGAGVVMGALDMLPIGRLIAKTPWLKKLASPKLLNQTFKTTAGRKWKDLAIKIAGSGLAEGFTEGGQELVQILDKNIFKTWDGTETKFFDGLWNTISDWETYKQSAKAATIGAVAGVAADVALETVGKVAEPVIDKIKKPKKPTDIVSDKTFDDKIKETAELRTTLENANENLKNSEIEKNLPDESKEMQQQMMEEAGVPHVFADKDALNEFSDSEEKAKVVDEAIVNSRSEGDAEIDAPLRLETAEVMRIAKKFPEILDIVKKDPTWGTVKDYIKRLQDAETERAILQKEMKDAGLDVPPKETIENRIKDEDIFNENDYNEQPTFTDAIEGVVSAFEVRQINEAQINARVQVSEQIKADVENDYNKLTSLETEAAKIAEREARIEDIETNPDVQTVEDFVNSRVFGDLTPEQETLLNKKIPVNAINPESLTPELRKKFVGNETLKKRKVFNVNGMNVKDVAQMFGHTNVEKFLNVLSLMPTRKEAVDSHMKAIEEDIKAEAVANNPFDETKLAEAYNDQTKNHLRELKTILDGNWAAFKKGVKRIVSPMPTIQELSEKALTKIKQTRIKDLNVNQYKVAERRSQRKATDAILKQEVEVAFREKENAAYATQLAKHTHGAIRTVNRALKWVARLQTRRMKNMLREAGPTYVKAIEDLLRLYNFGKQAGEIEGYQRYAQRMLEEGKGDHRIPDEVLAWLTTQKSAGNLTVEQLAYIVGKMMDVVHQARTKNKLYKALIKGTQEETIADIRDDVKEQLAEHPDRNVERIEEPEGIIAKNMDRLSWGALKFTNFQFIIQNILDQGNLSGYFAKLLYQPLMGTGDAQSNTGILYKVKKITELRKRWKEHVKEYGKAAFQKLGSEKVKIPEFKGIGTLKNGNLRKLDLLVLLTHMGNLENRQRITNFGITTDTMMTVLKRELTKKDFDFVQKAIWNEHKLNFPEIAAVHKRTTGRDLDSTINVSFEAFGTTYKGGYMPIKYKKNATIEGLLAQYQNDFDNADPTKKADFIPNQALEGIVRSPHTKARVGADWVLNYDVGTIQTGFDEVIHDIAMREPVRDVMAVLSDRDIAAEIKAVVGRRRYQELIAYVSEQTRRPTVNTWQDTEAFLGKIVDRFSTAAAIGYIAYNPSSIGMSVLSIPQIAARMGGLNAARHLSFAAMRMGALVGSKKMYDLALEIDPSIRVYKEGIGESTYTSLNDQLPVRRSITLKGFDKLARLKKTALVDFPLHGLLGGIDFYIKSITAVAGYNQFLAGNAKGHSLDSIMKMSTEVRHNAAKAYAQQLVASTTMSVDELSKAPIQKNLLGKIVTPFWNELRNVLNNTLGDVRRSRYGTKRAIKKAKSGDMIGAAGELIDVSGVIGMRLATALITVSIVGLIRGESGEGEDEERDVFTPDGKLDHTKYLWENMTSMDGLGLVASEMITSNIPVVNAFINSSKFGTGNVSFPVLNVGQAVYNTGTKFPEYLEGIQGGLKMAELRHFLTDKELREVLLSIGLVTKGIPANALVKFNKYLDEREANPDTETSVDGINNLLGATVGALTSFIKTHDKPETEEEAYARIEAQAEGKGTTLQGVVEQAKTELAKLAPSKAEDPLEDHEYEIIKWIESKGKKNARNYKRDKDNNFIRDKYGNKVLNSSAYGYYQFLEGTWDSVAKSVEGMKQGLTSWAEGGHYSPKQQEKAMRILTKQNAAALRKAGAEVSVESIYIAHVLGIENASKLYAASDKTKVSKVTDKIQRDKNEGLFEGVKTVGRFKEVIRKKIQDAENSL